MNLAIKLSLQADTTVPNKYIADVRWLDGPFKGDYFKGSYSTEESRLENIGKFISQSFSRILEKGLETID